MIEIRWQKTVSEEWYFSGSDRQILYCTQTLNKRDGQSNRSIKGWRGTQ
jgi:hypothetical protein